MVPGLIGMSIWHGTVYTRPCRVSDESLNRRGLAAVVFAKAENAWNPDGSE